MEEDTLKWAFVGQLLAVGALSWFELIGRFL